ncbi:GGDEF domain-containing protein [Arenimonas sp. GDDSR-1]|uniref:GGDEF domain-containing protein n=1 Tax=Arenimonas sp. GDDSR-1 TaxID=2950125 RepID=UPI002630E052|nr:GGDEF domain-containing protein [Arenimonas sp. GDDSR-1]
MGAQLQDLDITTLLVVHQMLALISTVVILAGAIHAKGRFGLWFWFGSFAATAGFQLLRDYGPTSETPSTAALMGQYGVLLNAAFILLAVKSYLGRPLHWRLIGAVTSLTAAMLWILSRSVPEYALPLALTLAVAAGLTAVALSDLLHAYRRERGFALGFGTFLIALLLGRLLLRGMIAIFPTGDGPVLAVNSTALLVFIAALVMQGFAILLLINDDLQKKMMALAEFDELTGLLNRRGMANRFKRLHQRALRDGTPEINLAVIDIDHFKTINDRFGHAVGDQVLTEMARRLESLVRPHDLCVRLGGEEFAMFWNGAPADMAAAMAERIRLAIGIRPFETREGLLRCTVSIGLSRMRPDENLEDFLDRADQALYVAKQGGRNKVVALAG